MLRPNYSNVEHVTTLIKLLTPSIVGRDLRFAYIKCVFFY